MSFICAAWLPLGGLSSRSADLASPLSPSSSHFLIFLFTSGTCLRSYLYTLTLTLLTRSAVFLMHSFFFFFFFLIRRCYETQNKKGEGKASLNTEGAQFHERPPYVRADQGTVCLRRSANGRLWFCMGWQD